MNLFERIKAILLQPKSEWAVMPSSPVGAIPHPEP